MKKLIIAILMVAMMLPVFAPAAQGHDIDWLGYPGCDPNWQWSWRDCYVSSTYGKWYQTSSGYWYRYVYFWYNHFWLGIYQYQDWRTAGYCWYQSYCVNY